MSPRRKSTLVGLRLPTSGSVMLAVEPEHVALVPDTPSFEPWLTAREMVALARSLVGLVVGVPAVDYVRPALVALVAAGILLWVAATRLQRREL